MKTAYLILTFLALVLIKPIGLSAKTESTSDSMLIHKQALKTVTIITPHSEVYDGGTFKKSFVGYSLSDNDNNLLIKVGSVLDIPVKLKIKEGTYIIRLNNQNPTSFYISVTAEHLHEFKIPE